MEAGASFGYWIRRQRKALDLTQVELATHAGVSVAMIRRLEADERRPSKEVAARLAQVLAIPAEDQATFLKVARAELAADHLPLATTHAVPVNSSATRTLSRRQHLPAQATSLIGRDHEVATVAGLLREEHVRLLTLTGPGGTGKTRLALAVVTELQHDFADGVWLVDLAPIRDPALVVPTIAATLELRQAGGQRLAMALPTYLQPKRILLLLDNFEQVVAAAPLLADLLKDAPHVRLLVTSRAVLHLSGEYEYPVPPLALPDVHALAPLDQIGAYPAVRLFEERARAIKHDFRLTAANAGPVLEVCRALDGLPLAIELAAARVKLLPPHALLPRLTNRLQILSATRLDHHPRHHTLRATIDWSYNLLEAAEQRLFARLAVFAGGWTLDAAEAICGGNEAEAGQGPQVDGTGTTVLDGIQSLLDKSMVRLIAGDGDQPRFVMLETLREYAVEQLVQSDDVDALRSRHARFFLALAEAAEREQHGAGGRHWMKLLLAEQNNLRAVLDFALSTAGEAEVGLRLATALWEFWMIYEDYGAARRRLEQALQCAADVPRALRARVLAHAADFAWRQGDLVRAAELGEESLRQFQEVGDEQGIAHALMILGHVADGQGDVALATARFEESLARFQAQGDTYFSAWALFDLGTLAYAAGNLPQALPPYEQSLALFRQLGHPFSISLLVKILAEVVQFQGEHARATALYAEGLRLGVEIRDMERAAWNIKGLAELADVDGRQESAARLGGASESVFAARYDQYPNVTTPDKYYRDLSALHARLEAAGFAAAWAEGRAMTPDQAVTYALENIR